MNKRATQRCARSTRKALAVTVALTATILIGVGFALRQQNLDERLVAAVERNDLASVRILLHSGADANVRASLEPKRSPLQILNGLLRGRLRAANVGSESVLAVAVKKNEFILVKTLLEGGATGVNETASFDGFFKEYHSLPIPYIAIRNRNPAVARLLIEHGAQLNRADEYGHGAVHSAIEDFPFLFNAHAYRHLSPSEKQVQVSRFKLVKLLVEHGATVHDPPCKGQSSNLDHCSLAIAAETNNYPLVCYLLEHGASQQEAQVALPKTVYINNVMMAKRLLRHGARFDRCDVKASSLLVNVESAEMASLLVKGGAVINRIEPRDTGTGSCLTIIEHQTSLHYAIGDRNLGLARFLIAHGADVNRLAEGYTPLMIAARTNIESVELLLRHGAKINQTSEHGAALLEAASGDSSIVKCLLRHGADPNFRDEYGETALIKAVVSEDKRSVRYLLQAGARVNARNRVGETALNSAKQDAGMVRLLKRWGGRLGKSRAAKLASSR